MGGNLPCYRWSGERDSPELAGRVSTRFHLILANERTGDRPWRGELHLVAIYDRAIRADEVLQNHQAGSNWAAVDIAALLPKAAESTIDFVKDVQPILRKHCYECHAEGNEDGGLNLGMKLEEHDGAFQVLDAGTPPVAQAVAGGEE